MKKNEKEFFLKLKLEEMKAYENQLYSKGQDYVAGVDEVGRGPLAGPVVAAAVILPKDFSVLGVDDSKKLSPKRREELYNQIIDNSIAYGIGWIDNLVIDQINILEATKLAMKIALEEAEKKLQARTGYSIDHILFDAVSIKDLDIPQTSIIKGDSKSVSIAAASIIAKVERDAFMVEMDNEYPSYAFKNNKGYGTKAHYEGLKKHGITPIHRKTFLKNLDEKH